jgi:hypothetical protein
MINLILDGSLHGITSTCTYLGKQVRYLTYIRSTVQVLRIPVPHHRGSTHGTSCLRISVAQPKPTKQLQFVSCLVWEAGPGWVAGVWSLQVWSGKTSVAKYYGTVVQSTPVSLSPSVLVVHLVSLLRTYIFFLQELQTIQWNFP